MSYDTCLYKINWKKTFCILPIYGIYICHSLSHPKKEIFQLCMFSIHWRDLGRHNTSDHLENKMRDNLKVVFIQRLCPCRYLKTTFFHFYSVLKEHFWSDLFLSVLKCLYFYSRLINTLSPGSVKKVNEGKMAFKMMENISNFLAALESYGVSRHDLFQTVDLYEGQNMVQVVNAIHALGRKVSNIISCKSCHIS